MSNLLGVYGGVVEENRDPEKLGRVKVRVPAVYGTAEEIPTDRLPWALPRGTPFGNSYDSGGISWLPAIGDTVWTTFLDGEPEKPLWEWGMGPKKSRDNLLLHEYSETQNGYPSRAILSRYGHSLEIKPDKVTLTTKEGQQLVLSMTDSENSGSVILSTPSGQSIRVSDLDANIVLQALESITASGRKVLINAPTSTTLKTGRLSITVGGVMVVIQEGTVQINTGSGATFGIDAEGNIVLMGASGASLSLEEAKVQLGEATGTGVVFESGKTSINSQQLVLNTSACAIGTAAKYPVLMLTPALMSWLLTHSHSNGNNGSPTGPPIMPWPTDSASQTLRTT